MTSDESHVGGRAGQALAGADRDHIPKAVGWVLGGFTIAGTALGALALVPRLAGSYQTWVISALVCMLVAFVFALLAAGSSYLRNRMDGEAKWSKRLHGYMMVSISIAAVALLGSIFILVICQARVLGKSEVPRLALSVTANDVSDGSPQSATVKLKFEADAIDPGGFVVVDILAIPVEEKRQRGDRIYRAAVGSDSSGRILSEIETEIPTAKYRLVVAEVYPGPITRQSGQSDSWANELTGFTFMCDDITSPTPRACAYAQIPH